MIKPPLYLFQVKVKIIFGYATILIEPVFGKTPEAFYAVQVISALGLAFVPGNTWLPRTEREAQACQSSV